MDSESDISDEKTDWVSWTSFNLPNVQEFSCETKRVRTKDWQTETVTDIKRGRDSLSEKDKEASHSESEMPTSKTEFTWYLYQHQRFSF